MNTVITTAVPTNSGHHQTLPFVSSNRLKMAVKQKAILIALHCRFLSEMVVDNQLLWVIQRKKKFSLSSQRKAKTKSSKIEAKLFHV